MRDKATTRAAATKSETPEIEAVRELMSDPFLNASAVSGVVRVLLPELEAQARTGNASAAERSLLLGAVRFFLFSVAADRFAWLYNAQLRLPQLDSGAIATMMFEPRLRLMTQEVRDWSKIPDVHTRLETAVNKKLADWVDDVATDMQRIANAHLREPATQRFLAEEYGLAKILFPDGDTTEDKPTRELNLHRVGTTSYILDLTEADGDRILKILKYRYVANPTIQAATENYWRNFRRLTNALEDVMVRVRDSAPAWIEMDRGPTTTLEDMIARHFRPTMSDTSDVGRLEEAVAMMTALFSRMGHFHSAVAMEARANPNFDASAVKGHFDLSPRNVLVKGMGRRDWDRRDGVFTADRSPNFELRLIDFGFNFVTREQVAPGDVWFDVARYCAPELKGSTGEGDYRSDLYSLGHIFLDILVPAVGYADVSARLDRVWRHFPAVGSLIASMIEQDPARRVPELDPADPSAAYNDLGHRLKVALTSDHELVNSLGVLNRSRKDGRFVELPIVVAVGRTMINLGRWSQERLKQRESDNRPGASFYLDGIAVYLAKWERMTLAALAIVYWFVVLAILVGTGLDKEVGRVDLGPIKPVIENFRDAIIWLGLEHIFLAGWRVTLPGWLLAFSVTVIAHFYFTIVIGKMSLCHLADRSYRWGEILLRAHPFIIAMGAVAAVLMPRMWPWLSIAGCMVTAATNVLLYSALKRATNSGQERLTTLASVTIDEVGKRFRGWSWGMAIYGGCFLAYGLAREWFGLDWTVQEDIKWASVFVLINIVIVARVILWRDGQGVRNILLRAFDGWHRAVSVPEGGPAAAR